MNDYFFSLETVLWEADFDNIVVYGTPSIECTIESLANENNQ